MIQHNDWTRYRAFLISRTFVEWFSDIYFPTLLDHFPKSNHQYILQWNIISSRQNTLFLFTVCKKMLNVKISLNGGNNFTNCILHISYKRFILGVVEWSICQSFLNTLFSRVKQSKEICIADDLTNIKLMFNHDLSFAILFFIVNS